MRGMVDIHCHILPGVDDGAESAKETVALLRREYEDGVRAIIVTPHYRVGMFETPEEIIEKEFRKVRRFLKRNGIKLQLYLGCEYHSHRLMAENLQKGLRPTLAGSDYVLTEFSAAHTYAQIRAQVYELITFGYIPIIAHVERYPCLLKKPELIMELKDLGAEIQITSGSLLQKAGWRVKGFCVRLLKEELVDYIATDAHHIKNRAPDLQECAQYLEKKFGKQYVERLLVTNPRNIIKNGMEKRKNEKGRIDSREIVL